MYSGDANYLTSQNTTSQTVNPVITASAGANGSIDPSGSVVVAYGTNQTFSIEPNYGYHVADVLVDDVSQGAITSHTFTGVTGPHSISASFALNSYPLNVTVSGTGTVSKVPDQGAYDHGSGVLATANPGSGFVFAGWTGDTISTVNPLTVIMNSAKNITATFSLSTLTITASAGPHGTISPLGDTQVPVNGSQTYTITPDETYQVDDVLVDGISVGAVTSYPFTNVIAPHTIHATFKLKTYTLTVNTVGSGSVVKNPDLPSYNHGATVGLTASAAAGYTFTGWSGNATGSTNPLTVTMDGNKSITATFTANAYNLTIVATNGTVARDPDLPTYGYNQNVELTATPNAGYSFTGWTGDATGTTNPVTIAMDGDKTVTANFAINSYTLTTPVVGSGTITRNPNQGSYDYNTSVQLTANPTTGWTFTGWSGDATGTTNPLTVLMTGAKSITATFTINSFTITVTAGSHGTITPPGPTTVNYGGNQHYTITPGPGVSRR